MKLRLILIFFLIPLIVGANGITSPITATNFDVLLSGIIDFLFTIGMTLAPAAIIIGAFYLMMSAGDPAGIETGRRIILYALIGIVILIIAKGLVSLIKEIIPTT